MSKHFETVKKYAMELDLEISNEVSSDEMIAVNDESKGIKNLILDCEEPVLVIEQFIFNLSPKAVKDSNTLLRLLQMNRGLVHGAFVVDEEGKKVIFRDTLQLENLDLNELEGTVNSLSLGLAEYGEEIIKFANQ